MACFKLVCVLSMCCKSKRESTACLFPIILISYPKYSPDVTGFGTTPTVLLAFCWMEAKTNYSHHIATVLSTLVLCTKIACIYTQGICIHARAWHMSCRCGSGSGSALIFLHNFNREKRLSFSLTGMTL